MTSEAAQKVTPRHLARTAYLYIRQSTIRQVVENTESPQRQYALRERAVALGWPPEQIIVIDTDLGQSGASAVDRAGFQRLVADVGLGRAGIVLGLEVSRLARNSSDWHRLLELCALTETLILDEDGLYDPTHFNDRLLLGLKGAMSEAELHLLHARLRGGLLNKARRGELRGPLPVGLVYDPQGRIGLDPDQQVQASVRLLFQTFVRTGTAYATVKTFREQGLSFPPARVAGPARASWSGSRSASPAPSPCCTIPATPGPTRSGAAGGASSPTAARRGNASRGSSGWCSCAMRTRATSPGRSMSRSSTACAPTPSPTAPNIGSAPHARRRPSCRGWPCVAAAGPA